MHGFALNPGPLDVTTYVVQTCDVDNKIIIVGGHICTASVELTHARPNNVLSDLQLCSQLICISTYNRH